MLEKVYLWFAWKLPARLVYWVAVRLFAHATTGQYGETVASELTLFEAVERWKTA